MIKFLVVRHGFSLANQQEIFAGATDIPLSETGLKQANLVSEYLLKNYTIDAVYSSELTRAKDTVKQVSEHLAIPLITLPAFNEIFGGKWEGVTFAEIYAKYKDDLLTWRNDIYNSRCTGGESFLELKNRVTKGLQSLAFNRENEGKTIVIASHAGAIRSLLAGILNLNERECSELGWVANASTTTIVYDNGKFTVESLGYADYLASLKTELPNNI